ncbi:MAG TPA: DUF3068 domain-containing protein [Candidatus Nanopelagicales bacterium]|nr:DUF3068 domain-containing protein [Candidatus Nanopelagicales bacterium]
MRRGWGLALIGLGVLFLALAPLLKFYAVPRLAVAPLNLDFKGDPSVASGTVAQVADLPTGTQRSDVPLVAVRHTGADVAASEQLGGNAGVYFSTQVVSEASDSQGLPYLPVSPERYAFDRTTDVMLAEADANVDGVKITPEMIAGDALMPLKMPFFTEKKTYNVFDSTLMKGVATEFVAEEQVQGLTTYHFRSHVDAVQYATQGTQTLWYQNTTDSWVEPMTGQVVNGASDTKQWLKNADGTDSLVLVDGTLAFTDQNVTDSVNQAKENSAKINLISNVAPVVLLVLGLIALVVGILLLRRDDEPAEPEAVGKRSVAV